MFGQVPYCVVIVLLVFQLDVKEYPDYLRELNQELSDTLEALKSTVRSKAAVPTSHVYVSTVQKSVIFLVFFNSPLLEGLSC